MFPRVSTRWKSGRERAAGPPSFNPEPVICSGGTSPRRVSISAAALEKCRIGRSSKFAAADIDTRLGDVHPEQMTGSGLKDGGPAARSRPDFQRVDTLGNISGEDAGNQRGFPFRRQSPLVAARAPVPIRPDPLVQPKAARARQSSLRLGALEPREAPLGYGAGGIIGCKQGRPGETVLSKHDAEERGLASKAEPAPVPDQLARLELRRGHQDKVLAFVRCSAGDNRLLARAEYGNFEGERGGEEYNSIALPVDGSVFALRMPRC